jgi:hypothetical protein
MIIKLNRGAILHYLASVVYPPYKTQKMVVIRKQALLKIQRTKHVKMEPENGFR